ncbi:MULTISPECIES: DUF397 domain-containing protein [unclassified Streptomyces]|uniref:DUF397 domain-containing protein n=1 Tax=unclassified Streptomyces TaxID=2593676 RepID=UPI000F717982|nr:MULTISPECIES: DUF397 domain-containing protein [unclassified Streptomyces]AZM62044.1 DUF397 domain-containing protein [Streptomyces sp. WAC 01438]RSM86152.1 DUF397 domain-containing protein [Streptomyces sp. WAC 01420]RSM97360.1 DUF397 domain-containing protein [Streptomyces sp. WAC 01420]
MSTTTPAARPARWFRSSYSNGAGGECVECAHVTSGTLIRDSKRADGPVVEVAATPWRAFVRSLERIAPR